MWWRCGIVSFVDDTVSVVKGDTWDNIKIKTSHGLVEINKWLKSNLLTLNIQKTNYYPFSLCKSILPNRIVHFQECDRSNCNCDIKKIKMIDVLYVLVQVLLSFTY